MENLTGILLTTANKINFPDSINLPDDWPVVVLGETGYTIGHQMSTSPVWGAERDLIIDQLNQGWSWEFIQVSEYSDSVYKKVDGIIVSWPNELPADSKERVKALCFHPFRYVSTHSITEENHCTLCGEKWFV